MIELLEIIEIEDTIGSIDAVKLNKTMSIIRRFGQHNLVLCNRTSTGSITLVSGRYILAACKALGKGFVYAYMFNSVTEEDIATLRLIQNVPKAVDVIATARLLEVVKDIKPLANLLPFTVDELKNFKDLKDFNWEDFDNNEQNFQTALF